MAKNQQNNNKTTQCLKITEKDFFLNIVPGTQKWCGKLVAFKKDK